MTPSHFENRLKNHVKINTKDEHKSFLLELGQGEKTFRHYMDQRFNGVIKQAVSDYEQLYNICNKNITEHDNYRKKRWLELRTSPTLWIAIISGVSGFLGFFIRDLISVVA